MLHYSAHFLPNLGLPNPFENNKLVWYISHTGHVFVEMYFIISGILFAIVYKKKIQSGIKFDVFIIQRIIRIFPLAAVTSVVMYLANIILYKINGNLWSCGTIDLWDLAGDIIFGGKAVFNTNNTLNGPIWYINVLMVCYVIAFVLCKLESKYKSQLLYVLPIIIGLSIYYSNISFMGLNESMARGYIAFFVGVSLGQVLGYFDGLSFKNKIIVRILLIIELVCMFFVVVKDITGNITDFYAFLVFPEIILLLYDCKLLNIICSSKFISFLGNISFGIYLWNFPILISIHILMVSKIIDVNVLTYQFLICIAVMHIVLASISNFLIDNKLCNKIKHCYERRHF